MRRPFKESKKEGERHSNLQSLHPIWALNLRVHGNMKRGSLSLKVWPGFEFFTLQMDYHHQREGGTTVRHNSLVVYSDAECKDMGCTDSTAH